MVDQALPILIAALLGCAYGVVGFVTNREPDESFEPLKLTRTVAIWSAAGIAVYVAGYDPADPALVGEYTAATAAGGYVIDQTYAMLVRTEAVPEEVEEAMGDPDDQDGSFIGPGDIDPDDLEAARSAVESAAEFIEEHDIKTSDYNDFVSLMAEEFDYETARSLWNELQDEGLVPTPGEVDSDSETKDG